MSSPVGSARKNTSLSVIAPKALSSSSSSDVPTPLGDTVLKPKSCLACRKRKVKCDRQLPCANCSRWSIECNFPSPIRRCPRVRSKPDARSCGDQALHDRIHMLEAQISELSGTVKTQTDMIRSLATPYVSSFPLNQTWAHAVAPLHPSLTLGQTYWQVFLERVDPLIKVVHRPSAFRILRNGLDNPTSLNESQGALLQVIYFACVSAMDEADIQANLQMSKRTALSTYRMAAEEALTRAGFMTTNDWTTLQALVLFIALSRLQSDHKCAWNLTGLAMRLDLSMEEDGSHFGAEMRRRLRWHLWYLNRRIRDDRVQSSSAVDQPSISSVGVDMPLNCHDWELRANMMASPSNQDSWTEMSFCLLRYDLAATERIVESDVPWLVKTNAVIECQRRLHSKYLAFCNGTESIHWLASHISDVIITEMWMKLYSPQFSPMGSSESSDLAFRENLFDAAVDILDTKKRLEDEIAAQKWEWTLGGYLQYVPLTFLLNELLGRRSDPRVDAAWEVAERSFQRWSEDARKSAAGVILTELMSNVLSARQEAANLQAIADTYLVPDPSLFGEVCGGQVYPDTMPDVFQLGLPTEWSIQHT